MYRPRAGTLKAKQLKEFKLEEEFKIRTKLIEKYIGKYYKIITK